MIIINKQEQKLQRIASFDVDHITLEPGLYLSRKDVFNGVVFTSYDVRITAPNKEPAVQVNALHTIEHLLATYYRNTEIKEDVVYVGPMGCLTGMYIVLHGVREPQEMHRIIKEGFEFIVNFDDSEKIPGASAVECGNYLLHDLAMAKYYARKYLAHLEESDTSTVSY